MNDTAHATPITLFEAAAAPAEAPDLAKLATAFAARMERARGLVDAGAVEALGNGRYKVRSGGGGWWAVRPGYCNCPDFAWRGAVPCKHIIAVELARPFLTEPAA
jgi:SWIM zinc finger